MADHKAALGLLTRIIEFPIGGSSWRFLLLAVFLQFLLYDSINQVFPATPPLAGPLSSFSPRLDRPPAKRLVIFIGDGVPSQSLYANDMVVTPHLRAVAKQRGVHGVSHTSVPTETRAGHVAMLAGMREDLNSVTANWAEAAVDFDHLFNRSSYTYAWGSPSVLIMFPVKGRMETVTHHHSRENFAGDDAVNLLNEMVQSVSLTLSRLPDSTRARLRKQNGLVFFLHLISSDLGGHSFKPFTEGYRQLLHRIDDLVAKVEVTIDRFFEHDGRTAFLFTADHGMTTWGMHGGGGETETSTPFLAWGSGVHGPLPRAVDLQQTDLCPLMASLLALPIPSNSRGTLAHRLINATARERAVLLRENVRQLLQLLQRTREEKRSSAMSCFFHDFDRLSPKAAEKRLQDVQQALELNHAEAAVSLLQNLAADAQSGLRFFMQQDHSFYRICIAALFTLWTLCLGISTVTRPTTTAGDPMPPAEAAIGLCCLAGQLLVLMVERGPISDWLLRLAPLLLLWCLLRQVRRLPSFSVTAHGVVSLLVAVVGLELLVVAYFWRSVLALAVVVHVVWQLLSRATMLRSATAFLASGIALFLSPLLPGIGANTELRFVPLGGLSIVAVFLLLLLLRPRLTRLQRLGFSLQITLLLAAVLTHHKAHEAILAGGVLPSTIQAINWAICLTAFSIAVIVSATSVTSIAFLSTALSICVSYVLLSLSFESLFLLALLLHICAWVSMEGGDGEEDSWSAVFYFVPPESASDLNLFRQCFSYVVLMQVALLGAGHAASVSSYDPNSLFPLYTIFIPSIMVPLAFFKLLLPHVLTSFLFAILTARRPLADVIRASFFFMNIVAFNFFLLVPSEGSSTAIGTSVGHFVIAMVSSFVAITFLSLGRLAFRKSLNFSIKTLPNGQV